MKRVGLLALALCALTLTVLLSAPRTASAVTCTCLATVHQTPTENAKSPNSCAEAQSKLLNKLILDEACTDVCNESPIHYTTACYYDPADARYHVSGYLTYQCAINCDPFP